jgi:hypothetical protein
MKIHTCTVSHVHILYMHAYIREMQLFISIWLSSLQVTLESSQDQAVAVIICSKESGNDLDLRHLINLVPDTGHCKKNLRNCSFYSQYSSDLMDHNYLRMKMHFAVGSMMSHSTISLLMQHTHYEHTCREGDEGDTDEEDNEDELPLL